MKTNEKKKPRFISLNIKVFFLAIAVAMLPALVMGAVIYRQSVDIVTEKQENAVRNSFQNMSDKIEMTLDYTRSTSLSVIGNTTVRRAFTKQNPTRSELLIWNNTILSDLKYFIGQNSYLGGICLTGLNGVVIQLGTVDQEIVTDNLDRMTETHGKAVWRWKETQNGLNLFLLRELRDTEDPSTVLGYLEIMVSGDVVQESFQEFLEAYPGEISLRNTNGERIFSLGEIGGEQEISEMPDEAGAFGWFRKNGLLTYYCNVGNTEWQIVSNMQESEVFSDNRAIRTTFLSMIGACLFLGLLIVFIFSRIIVHPIRRLADETVKISNNDYNIQTDIRSNDEIGLLGTRFQVMAKKLDELVNEVLRGKMLQQETQYRALQAQINPHFLYNNLDTAYWMSRMERAEKTGKILLSLSALYRSAANTKGKLIPVEAEIKYAKDYIVIQEMRLGEQVLFEIETEEEAKSLTTLRFLLQPLIENSIEHGILPTGLAGKITLRVFRQEETLYFEIEDSGGEAKAEEITELLNREEIAGEKRGMAIRNIHQRIQIQYGSSYGLSFENVEGGGIRTVVRQPAKLYVQETAGIKGSS